MRVGDKPASCHNRGTHSGSRCLDKAVLPQGVRVGGGGGTALGTTCPSWGTPSDAATMTPLLLLIVLGACTLPFRATTVTRFVQQFVCSTPSIRWAQLPGWALSDMIFNPFLCD